MTTYTIDTAAAINNLIENGVEEKQAKAIVNMVAESHDQVATKGDIEKLSANLDAKFAQIDTKFANQRFWFFTAMVSAVAVIKILDYLLPAVGAG